MQGVDFIGGDFNLAVRGPVADVFSDTEFMGPGTIPLWGSGEFATGRHRLHGLHMYAPTTVLLVCQEPRDSHVQNAHLGLNERYESTHYPVFMHLWATHLPDGTRAALRSDAAQSRRIQRAATKNDDRKRQRRLNQAAGNNVDNATSTASAGQLQPTLLDGYEELIEV